MVSGIGKNIRDGLITLFAGCVVVAIVCSRLSGFCVRLRVLNKQKRNQSNNGMPKAQNKRRMGDRKTQEEGIMSNPTTTYRIAQYVNLAQDWAMVDLGMNKSTMVERLKDLRASHLKDLPNNIFY